MKLHAGIPVSGAKEVANVKLDYRHCWFRNLMILIEDPVSSVVGPTAAASKHRIRKSPSETLS
jgi:hypothetical protein